MARTEFIEVDVQGPVARVWLARPRIHNAINAGMIAELTAAFEGFHGDDAVRVVVLGGRGRSFCVGADLKWMLEKGDASEADNLEDARRLARMLRALHDLDKPTIARVQGLTIGGGNGMVAACDLAVGSTAASFRTAETKLGIVPAVISPYLIRKLGATVCRELFLTARDVPAREAVTFGLLNRAVAPEELDAVVDGWVAAILRNGPRALVAAKELLAAVSSMGLDEAGEHTARLIARLRSSDEGREGMRAFFEKRDPDWVVTPGAGGDGAP